MQQKLYDLIVIGAGASGLIASIIASKKNKSVLLIEQLPQIGTKLKASGGGRCNLANTLDNTTFIKSFGKNGRFITNAIDQFNYKKLIKFFNTIGVETDILDGFRIFPKTHNSTIVIKQFEKYLIKNQVQTLLNTKVTDLIIKDNIAKGIKTNSLEEYFGKNILIATGGLGYPTLGATGEMFNILKQYNHTITPLAPAMMPLFTKEKWVKNCTADTIPKVTIKINLKKYSKIKISGDLIFTKHGLRGPAILDISKYINKILLTKKEVPILIHLTKYNNEDQIISHIKTFIKKHNISNILTILETLLPTSVSKELLKLTNIDFNLTYNKIEGIKKTKLIKLLASTPFTIIGNEGFKKAMVTNGGVSLKQIDPTTLESKIIKNLFFAGEIIDIDGPCGGYNLQWAFSSGYLVGTNIH